MSETGLSETNLLYWTKYLRHCWDFSAPRELCPLVAPLRGPQNKHDTLPLDWGSATQCAFYYPANALLKQSPPTVDTWQWITPRSCGINETASAGTRGVEPVSSEISDFMPCGMHRVVFYISNMLLKPGLWSRKFRHLRLLAISFIRLRRSAVLVT